MSTIAAQNIVALPTKYLKNHFKLPMISEVDLLDVLFPGYWEEQKFLKISYAEETAAIMGFCSKNNFHYYAKPKGEYNEYEALQEADLKRFDGVVVDCLS